MVTRNFPRIDKYFAVFNKTLYHTAHGILHS